MSSQARWSLRWSGPGGGVSPVAVRPPGAGCGAGRCSHSAPSRRSIDGVLVELVDVLGVDERRGARRASVDHEPVEDVLLRRGEHVPDGADVDAVGRRRPRVRGRRPASSTVLRDPCRRGYPGDADRRVGPSVLPAKVPRPCPMNVLPSPEAAPSRAASPSSPRKLADVHLHARSEASAERARASIAKQRERLGDDAGPGAVTVTTDWADLGERDVPRRGRRRGARDQGRRARASRQRRRRRRDPRDDHVVAVDLGARGRQRPARPLRRPARLQPRPADAADRARVPGAGLGDDDRARDGAVRGARQDRRRRPGLARASSSTSCSSRTSSPPSTSWSSTACGPRTSTSA